MNNDSPLSGFSVQVKTELKKKVRGTLELHLKIGLIKSSLNGVIALKPQGNDNLTVALYCYFW